MLGNLEPDLSPPKLYLNAFAKKKKKKNSNVSKLVEISNATVNFGYSLL